MILTSLFSYDVFISYKSKDVYLARKLADQLIASRKHVWFAEYEILLSRRQDFLKAIEKGLKKTKYGIIITNNECIDSPYCRYEIEHLLNNCGSEKIIEVQSPPENKPHILYPALKTSRRFVYNDNIKELISYIEENTKFSILPLIVNDHSPEEYIGNYHGQTYMIKTPGWIFQEMAEPYHSLSTPGPIMQYGKLPLFVNLYIGQELDPNARDKFNNPDDRVMYDTLVQYSIGHLNEFETKPKGVHLIWHKSGNNFAVTYRQKTYWTRKVSILLNGPDADEITEFVFTFGFLGPFRQYCLYAHIMDDFATSVSWSHEVCV